MDMTLMYGNANENCEAAAPLYAHRFSNSHTPVPARFLTVAQRGRDA